ncbi:MAG: ZIP family metal transporter [Candidatus Sulfotelmatobacter sp.]
MVGGWIAVRQRHRVHVLLRFGAGVLLGASFFDLLPEAIAAAGKHDWTIRTTLALPVLGFLLFYGADRFLETHICPTGDRESEARRRIGRVSAVVLFGHSAIDGASIAAATLVSWRTGLIVALGIIAHDLSDGLNTMLLVTHGELAGPRAYAFLFADALAPVLGGLLVLETKMSPQSMMVLLGLTSGLFLFTATDDLPQKAHRRSSSLLCQLLPGGSLHSADCRIRLEYCLAQAPSRGDVTNVQVLFFFEVYRSSCTTFSDWGRICFYPFSPNLNSF